MKHDAKPQGMCQWNDCKNVATKNRYKLVREKNLRHPVTKQRIWFEHCFICDACDAEAGKEYDLQSFVAPYEK